MEAPVKDRLRFSDITSYQFKIKSKDTIVWHGSYRAHSSKSNHRHRLNARNILLNLFPNQKILFFINNEQDLDIENRTLSADKDVKLVIQSDWHLYEQAKKKFAENKIVIIPDMAFMVGDMMPRLAPRVDILVLFDVKSSEQFTKWTLAMSRKLVQNPNVTFLVI